MTKIKWFSDIGSNHNQSYERAIELIKESAALGCDGVKFQLYTGDELYISAENILEAQKMALNPFWIPDLSKQARALGLEFGITPFSLNGVKKCRDHVDYLKVASLSGLYFDLIKACIDTGLPVTISTGILDFGLIGKMVNYFDSVIDIDSSLDILWCCPEYPAPIEDCNLWVINDLINAFWCDKTKIGWSDHTKNEFILHRAITNGANIIEFHLDLPDMLGNESKHGHCWTVDEIGPVIKGYKDTECSEANTYYTDLFSGRLGKYGDIIANPLTGRRG